MWPMAKAAHMMPGGEREGVGGGRGGGGWGVGRDWCEACAVSWGLAGSRWPARGTRASHWGGHEAAAGLVPERRRRPPPNRCAWCNALAPNPPQMLTNAEGQGGDDAEGGVDGQVFIDGVHSTHRGHVGVDCRGGGGGGGAARGEARWWWALWWGTEQALAGGRRRARRAGWEQRGGAGRGVRVRAAAGRHGGRRAGADARAGVQRGEVLGDGATACMAAARGALAARQRARWARFAAGRREPGGARRQLDTCRPFLNRHDRHSL